MRPPAFENTLLAVLSGLLLTAAFPPGHLFVLSWIALIPLLMSIHRAAPAAAFRRGVIAGLAHYLTLIYWIVVVLGHYGNLNVFISLFALFLLSAYLSLYVGLFSYLACFTMDSRFVLILLPAFWVALEYLRAHFLTGFPWCLLGYTQYKALHVIQVADILGIYGVSFFIVVINVFLFRAILYRRQPVSGFKFEALGVVLLTGGILAYGHYCLWHEAVPKETHPHLDTAVIQANIDQSLKWDPAYQTQTLMTYETLTRKAAKRHPELIVWPETAVPFFFQNNPRLSPRIFRLSQEIDTMLLFGSPAYRGVDGTLRYYNRAYLMTPGHREMKTYDKVHLVPFGEYVPLRQLLPFLGRLVQAAGDFMPGETATPLTADNLSLGVLICFEAIFPKLARNLVNQGADVLINLTNDAWFGMSSAPYQHLSMAVFRSVETRRPMIRAANTGFSAYINTRGRIQAISPLFTEAVLHHAVALSPRGYTVYSRVGDLFALALAGLCTLKILMVIRRAWKRRKS